MDENPYKAPAEDQPPPLKHEPQQESPGRPTPWLLIIVLGVFSLLGLGGGPAAPIGLFFGAVAIYTWYSYTFGENRRA
ncbi:MAG TPA: hypothetical protein VHC22_07000 [Pirellulales bacterium]|nr:hypothetical protein [Pirellulales bacterium]